MKRIGQWVFFLIFLLMLPASPLAAQDAAESQAPVVVGRISFVTGQLLKYVPEENDWVATVADAPFGLNDALYSGDNSQAEFIIPNGAWMRIGADSQIQLIAVEDEITEADVAQGIVRFYNKSDSAAIKATTPFGYVFADPHTVFDLYVGDNSVEVISLKGEVDFIDATGGGRFQVFAGGPSILADNHEVSSGEGTVDTAWDEWNHERDNLWANRLSARGPSFEYLPDRLHDEAYVLDDYGAWERVYYDGGYRMFWRPVRVNRAWAPFTRGHWTVWYDDNCWIPDEPFGYVTHHYGNWVYINSYWYWAPPMTFWGPPREPVAGIGFGWYPGRVSWIYQDDYVGWVPLASSEPYYCHRSWGPRCASVSHAEVSITHIDRYAYYRHAVVIQQTNFYKVNTYRFIRITTINSYKSFKTAPVVNKTVIQNYDVIPRKYYFTNATVTRKPHDVVVQRIHTNDRIAKESQKLNRNTAWKDAERIRIAEPAQGAAIASPVVSNKLVTPDKMKKPASEVNFSRKEIKGENAVKPVPAQSEPAATAPGGNSGYPQAAPEEHYPLSQQPSGSRPTSPAIQQNAPVLPEAHHPQGQPGASPQYWNKTQPPGQETRIAPPPTQAPVEERPVAPKRPQVQEPMNPISEPTEIQPPSTQERHKGPKPPQQGHRIEEGTTAPAEPQEVQPSMQHHQNFEQPATQQRQPGMEPAAPGGAESRSPEYQYQQGHRPSGGQDRQPPESSAPQGGYKKQMPAKKYPQVQQEQPQEQQRGQQPDQESNTNPNYRQQEPQPPTQHYQQPTPQQFQQQQFQRQPRQEQPQEQQKGQQPGQESYTGPNSRRQESRPSMQHYQQPTQQQQFQRQPQQPAQPQGQPQEQNEQGQQPKKEKKHPSQENQEQQQQQ